MAGSLFLLFPALPPPICRTGQLWQVTETYISLMATVPGHTGTRHCLNPWIMGRSGGTIFPPVHGQTLHLLVSTGHSEESALTPIIRTGSWPLLSIPI